MATPFLLMLFQPMEAIQINLIVSLLISAALIFNIRKDVDKGRLKRLIVGSLPGIPIGISIFLWADIETLKIGIGIVLLVLTLLLMLNMRIRKSGRADLITGGLSGAFTSGIGMPGPPLLLYFAGSDTKKAALRATTLAYYLFIYSIALILQLVVVGTNRLIWISSSQAIPLVLVGLVAGQWLYHRINQVHFKRFTYVILLFTGIYLLI